MRKTLITLLALSAAASLLAVPAEAKKKPKKIERVVEVNYDNPAIGSGTTGGIGLGVPTIPTSTKEVFISIEVADDVNPMAGVRVRWDVDGDDTSDGAFFVCGSTPEPVAIPGGVTLDVFPYIGGDASCPGSSAFSGTVKATLSNLP
jgi:hypothetical protein